MVEERAGRSSYRVVGVVHLPALPGSAGGGPGDSLEEILDRAKRDALGYAEGGAGAIIVENFGDVPFVKDLVAPVTVAAMTRAVAAVREISGLPVGVNVLRNDVLSAVAIAAVCGGSFVRANVYVGAAVTDQGLIEGRAAEVQALIRSLNVPVAVWADVDVKHAAPVAPRPLGEVALDAIERGLAGAVVVTGRGTGAPVAPADLLEVRRALPRAPIYIGSGATVETLPSLLEIADGAIVGTAAKIDGVVTNAVAVERVRALVAAAR